MKLNELKLTNTGLTVRKKEEDKPSVLKKLTSVYDEFAKLVFLIDVSGSMEARIAVNKNGKSLVGQYTWTDGILHDIRRRAEAAIANVNAYNTAMSPMSILSVAAYTAATEPTEEDTKLAGLADITDVRTGTLTFTPADDEELKIRIVRADLINFLGIAVDRGKSPVVPPTRLDLVKKLGRQEIEKRFAKYPDSRVAVVPFGSIVTVPFDDGVAADLWPILENLNTNEHGGGTDILASIKVGIDVCRKNPSAVGLHHFVLVTDGGDYNASIRIAEWVPALKASGIVLDYIHIGDSDANEGLINACKELGGEYVSVNTEEDFEKHFVEAMNRLMLPAPTV